LRLNLGDGIRKSSPAWRSRSVTPNLPLLSAQAQARSISSTSLIEFLSPPPLDQAQPAQPVTPLWKKSLSLLSSYIDPDKYRVLAPPQEEKKEEEEEDNDDDKMEDVEEIDEET
jgi:hypothetical protein